MAYSVLLKNTEKAVSLSKKTLASIEKEYQLWMNVADGEYLENLETSWTQY